MPVQQHILNWLYSILTGEYHNVNRTYNDVAQALDRYPSLAPRTDVHTFPDGSSALLLHLSGTLPVRFRGATYRFPISIWVPHAYPREPPIGYVTPTGSMVVRPGQHVDPQGQVYHPYLNHWTAFWDKSTLLDFLGILTDVFSKEPPVIAKQQQAAHPAPPPQQQQPPLQAGDGPPPVPPLPPGLAPRPAAVAPSQPVAELPPPLPPPPPPRPSPLQNQPELDSSLPPQTPSLGPPPRPPPPPAALLSALDGADPQHQHQHQHQHQQHEQQQQHEHHQHQHEHQQHQHQYQHQQTQPLSRYETAPPLPPQSSPRPIEIRSVYASPPPVVQPEPAGLVSPPPAATYHHPPPAPRLAGVPASLPPRPPVFSLPLRLHAPSPVPPPQPPPPPQQIQPRSPPPSLLDDPLPADESSLASAVKPAPPPPPIPPNPEKDAKVAELARALHSIRQAALRQNDSILAAVQDQLAAVQADAAAFQAELANLSQTEALLTSNTTLLHEAIRKANATIEQSRSHPVPNVDELLVAPTVVANQLYNLVAEERAIGDTIFTLGRAVERGRVSTAVFTKTTRALAREWYLKKALIRKISRGMGLMS